MGKTIKDFFETIMTITVGSEKSILESETKKFIIIK